MATGSSDLGGIKGDCAYNAARGISTNAYVDGTPVNCKTKDVWNLDLTVSQKVADKFTIYANVLNLLDTKPPFDPDAAYGLFGFNPAWAGPNGMGRYRSEEHTSELQSLMRISYADFCLKNKNKKQQTHHKQ